MSRLRNLKDRNKKIIMKATSYGLALALVLGSAQVLGTYALFTDTETIPSEISLSTGDVDVKVNEGRGIENIQPGQGDRLYVEITNQGTLNQNIKLEINSDIMEYLDYSFDFSKTIESEGSEDPIVYEPYEVKNGVIYNKGENTLFVLAPGSSIDFFINVSVKKIKPEQENELVGKAHNINLTVTSSQITSNNKEFFGKGFIDTDTQKNTITIAQSQIITVATGKNAHYINGNGNKYESVYVPLNVNGLTEIDKNKLKITAEVNGRLDKYSASYIDLGQFKYLKIEPLKKGDKVSTESSGNNVAFQDLLNITLKISIEGKVEEYEQYFWIGQANAGIGGPRGCDGVGHPIGEKDKRCQIQVVNPGHKHNATLEERPIQEEIEVPNNQEIINPPKEEVEVPNNPEIVEPPKEEEIEVPNNPEVVEPPKEEEIEVPNNPEAIEPPKENEELQ